MCRENFITSQTARFTRRKITTGKKQYFIDGWTYMNFNLLKVFKKKPVFPNEKTETVVMFSSVADYKKYTVIKK